MTKRKDFGPGDIEKAAGKALQAWAAAVTKQVGPDEAWRVLLGAAVSVMQGLMRPEDVVAILRQAADLIDGGFLQKDLI